MMVGLEIDRVIQGLKILENQARENNRMLSIVEDYKVPNVSEKVIRIINSYIDYE